MMKFAPHHPQRSYVKKTPEATGLPQRTISWICQSPKSCTASSSAAAQNSQSVNYATRTPSLLHCSTAEDGFKTSRLMAVRLRRKLKLNTGRGRTTSVKARLRSWSSTLQKISHVKKTEIYLSFVMAFNAIS